MEGKLVKIQDYVVLFSIPPIGDSTVLFYIWQFFGPIFHPFGPIIHLTIGLAISLIYTNKQDKYKSIKTFIKVG